MNKSNLMSRAHKIAKTLVGDYSARLSMALKMVWAEVKKGVKKMVELIGSEKQIAWAKDIKKDIISMLEIRITNPEENRETYLKIGKKFGVPSGKENIIKGVKEILEIAKKGVENETDCRRIIDWRINESYLSKEMMESYGWM